MNHDNNKSLIFYFLQRIDYNQTWEKIESDMGYDLGDSHFGEKDTQIREKVRRLAKQMWIELNGVLDKNGN